MKRTVLLCAAVLVLAACSIYAFADIARPKTSPTPAPSKIVLHTRLTIVPDAKVWEARLQMSPETLKSLGEESAGMSTNQSMAQRIAHSSTRTIMAGLFMFLTVSFAGIWLARSTQRRNHKAVAAVVMVAAVVGLATVIVRANAGPPGSYYWRNLPDNLTKSKATDGGIDIEIVPGMDGIKLIVPIKNQKKPGEE